VFIFKALAAFPKSCYQLGLSSFSSTDPTARRPRQFRISAAIYFCEGMELSEISLIYPPVSSLEQ
jgi:hypothetical protein